MDNLREAIAAAIHQEVYIEDTDGGDSRVEGTTEAVNRVMEVLEQRHLLDSQGGGDDD